jgi:hypothetical protein
VRRHVSNVPFRKLRLLFYLRVSKRIETYAARPPSRLEIESLSIPKMRERFVHFYLRFVSTRARCSGVKL